MKTSVLSGQDRATLLELARSAILRSLGHTSSEPPISDRLKSMKGGMFVTLRFDGELRGCIGYVEPMDTLAECVRQLAVKSASEDPRFAAIHSSEMDSLVIEISVLSPLQPCSDVRKIEIGRHGLVVEQGWKRGLLLPEVAIDAGWDPGTFIRQCCKKAGLSLNAWEDSRTMIFTFETEHFTSEDTSGMTQKGSV